MKPYGERKAQGIADQNDTYLRLCEDFPGLSIKNDTHNRKHVDFEVTFPDGYVELIEHKAWAGHYQMTVKHYMDTRPKFKGHKGGTCISRAHNRRPTTRQSPWTETSAPGPTATAS